MMSEIKTNETPEVKNPNVENFKEIKPETSMSVNEAKDFWENKFRETEERTPEDQEFHDDNGKLYRVGNELLPNTEYEVNGYKYTTDAQGRISSAEGKLKVPEKKERDMEAFTNLADKDYKEGDDRGHLIGHQFGGSDKLDNLVPMNEKLNQGDYKNLEMSLRDAVEDGADVNLKVEPMYESDSKRPDSYVVTYTVDGDKNVRVFRNESEVVSR